MKNKINSAVVIIIFTVLSIVGLSSGKMVHAESTLHKEKHEQVLQQRQAQKIRPLAEILKTITPHIRGEIIETEFEIEHGRPIYEFKYISASGRVMEIYVDARTGRIIKEKID